MRVLKSPLFFLFVFFIVVAALSGCDVREETLTFTPTQTASIYGEHQTQNFGVCAPLTLDRRGTRLYIWDEFKRQLAMGGGDHPSNFAGYEVSVSRGESCHLRILDTFQAAVMFDLSSLPSTAVVSADLIVTEYFSPLDPPYLRGTSEQCTVMLIGEATQSWVSGIYGRSADELGSLPPRPFITYIPARVDAGPHLAQGIIGAHHYDVFRTVSEWVRGVRTNNGFVITPDLESVMDIFENTSEGGFFCDMGITSFQLVVTVAASDG